MEGKLRNQIVPTFTPPYAQMSSDAVMLAKESLMFLKTLVTVSIKGVKWAMPALPLLKSLLETSMDVRLMQIVKWWIPSDF